MTKRLLIIIAILIPLKLSAQRAAEFQPAADSLRALLKERTGVDTEFKIKRLTVRGTALDFNMTWEFGSYPWRDGDISWAKDTIKTFFPEKWGGYTVGHFLVNGNKLRPYVMPELASDGRPVATVFRTADPRGTNGFISRIDAQEYPLGLSGRNIALWQSHGRYYEEKTSRWEWQRSPNFQTVEDMFTQSFVLPFLIPMLENAGAYTMTPRERDLQTNEIICDNDKAFTEGRGPAVRSEGIYSESGTWTDAGTGFADLKAEYRLLDNPFKAGTARQAACGGEYSSVRWTPEILQRGRYGVYISYKSLPASTERAHYTVRHLGGETEFSVNQKMGGGTWIYLGTFEFGEGRDGCVILDTDAPQGHEAKAGTVVTADAVRFGGGMGKYARGQKDSLYATISGYPSFAEGAYYWMQWAGADSCVVRKYEDDYTSDFGDRGAWVGWMSGGSRTNPEEKGLGIPIDLSFAFHTDAGVAQNDTIIGTLAIYTLKCDGSDKFPNGEDRLQQRLYADFVQTQTVNDLQAQYNPEWVRRGLWDRSYSESRTATVPAMILELLSHQNFADMRFGLDPAFRFTVSRAVYKGMLKFLSARYGCNYAVQPLPVNSFSLSFASAPSSAQTSKVELKWKETIDTLEPTAAAKGYLLQTRIDDGPFDEGVNISGSLLSDGTVSATVDIDPGHVYSYRIVAWNDGGRSFPSETLSVGVPSVQCLGTVGVINNFTRVSSPAWFDSQDYGGFLNSLDSGVPYMQEINFIGEQYEYRKQMEWKDDDNPGYGGSRTDKAAQVYAGNTFDYPALHGKALMNSGYAFHSASASAFAEDKTLTVGDFAIDIICGKQIRTVNGTGKVPDRYAVFPEKIRAAISDYTLRGGNVIISGAYIGTDIWDCVYPVTKDSLDTVQAKEFAEKTLGYKWLTNRGSFNGKVAPFGGKSKDMGGFEFYMKHNPDRYCVETPDGIVPANGARTFLRYADTGISAGIIFKGKGYMTACLGFPIETIQKEEDINSLISNILTHLKH